ncbi:MAG TPA: S1 RNA-binding domain-containing protein, partial [Rubrivivax sp.]|nr:S1 RNA-binding domain-containing protein [Rubrivivax sp.]
ERFGVITVRDILADLEKPGRDPRPDFRVARLDDAIAELKDLQPGMLLEGTVSNVAQFGAFVDLGVHQDGLVHVSQLSHKFVKDAREVVRTGQVVSVRVLEVDLARKRISLTMKLDAVAAPHDAGNAFRPAARDERSRRGDRASAAGGGAAVAGNAAGGGRAAAPGSAMAAAFAKLQQGRR